jgi:ubiquinone/menaquinone biosynthesis C-methylase UbiE
MDRKTYIKNIYSVFWITAREKKYGFLEYDKNLCEYLCRNVFGNAKLLDVGCGTGYPFGDFFNKAGYKIYGIDISPSLIKKCQELYPNIKSKIGDAENIPYPDNNFDTTYCFHSSWYFTDLKKAIDEMIRVTRPGGFIIFDAMNYHNQDIKRECQKEININRGLGRVKKYLKNIAKIILRKGTPDWHFVVVTSPTKPDEVCQYLWSKKINNFKVLTKEKDDSIKLQETLGLFPEYPRLIFIIQK